MTTGKKMQAARPDDTGSVTATVFSRKHPARVAGRHVLDTALDAQAKALSGLTEAWQQRLGFVAQRLERDRDLVLELAEVHSASEMPAIFARFLGEAQHAYWEEMQRVFERSAANAKTATETLQQMAKGATNPVSAPESGDTPETRAA